MVPNGCEVASRPRSSIRRITTWRSSGSVEPWRRRPVASRPICSVVSSFEDLRSRASEARGKIVLFDVAYGGYAETVTYRNGGARAAAQQGALAVLVRSIGPVGLRTAHTGSVNYIPEVTAIPAAALAAEDANRLVRLLAPAAAYVCGFCSKGAARPTSSPPTSSARSSDARSRTRSCCSADISIRGTSERARRTMASDASSRGRRCA